MSQPGLNSLQYQKKHDSPSLTTTANFFQIVSNLRYFTPTYAEHFATNSSINEKKNKIGI